VTRTFKVITEFLKNIFWRIFFMSPQPLAKHLYLLGRTLFIADGRDGYFAYAFEMVRRQKVQGDYLEFGVYKGDSFITAMKLADRYKLLNMRFFAFDCFEGVPGSEGWVQKGAYCCSESLFRAIISKAGVDVSRTAIIKGLYADTLVDSLKALHHLFRAAIIHIDCDLYSSTVDVLRFVEPLCQNGTIIIFDDWYIFGAGNATSMGEGKAFEEWRFREHFHPIFDFPGRSKAFMFNRALG
jgi:O-methyltransferase